MSRSKRLLNPEIRGQYIHFLCGREIRGQKSGTCCNGTDGFAMDAMRSMKTRLDLTVNEEKTHICRIPEGTFDFLGYTMGRCFPTMKNGKAVYGTWPSQKSVQHAFMVISDKTHCRWESRDAGELVKDLNRMLVGWANYFSMGLVRKGYRAVEEHTKARLRQWLCRKHKQKGDGKARYPDRYLHQKLGLVSLQEHRRNFLRALA